MTVRDEIKKPDIQIKIGLVFLIFASLSNWYLRSRAVPPEDWMDGVTGLFYGISIGFMLLGIWRKHHSPEPED